MGMPNSSVCSAFNNALTYSLPLARQIYPKISSKPPIKIYHIDLHLIFPDITPCTTPNTTDGNCYWNISTPLSWSDSLRECEVVGGTLAIVSSSSIKTFLDAQ